MHALATEKKSFEGISIFNSGSHLVQWRGTRVRTEIGNQNSRTFQGLFTFFPGVIFHRQ